MSTKITTCEKCKSTNIKELNPESRYTTTGNICKITCECKECGTTFTIKSWTEYGKRSGILY